MARKLLEPIHPGEILEKDFMRPLGLSANGLAKALDVPVTRVSDIVRGRRGITADTALRLGRFFATSPELWLGLQTEYDLRIARRDFGEVIERRVPSRRPPGSRHANSSGATSAPLSEIHESAARYGRAPSAPTRDRRRVRNRIRAKR